MALFILFAFLVFFGFFGFYYKGEMSGQLVDECLAENKIRADKVAYRFAAIASFVILWVYVLIIDQLSIPKDYAIIYFVISLSLSFAGTLFLQQYYLYYLDWYEIDFMVNERCKRNCKKRKVK